MEINKQLFEDVLSGKLKGTFVLKNGKKIPSDALKRHIFYYELYIDGRLYFYYDNGRFSCCSETQTDIIDFIPDTIEIDPEMYSYNEKDIQFIKHFINSYHMKENELTIEIPEGKIIDWDESKKQNKIVLKDKQLTYEDVCKELFNVDHYAIAWEGYPIKCCAAIYNASNAPTEHQLECILAKNKLANVAKYLNNGWKPLFDSKIFLLRQTSTGFSVFEAISGSCAADNGSIWFKSKELAQQAIEILGEETIKLALEPLGI